MRREAGAALGGPRRRRGHAMTLFPSGFPRWLRLARAGQHVRARALVRAEARRAEEARHSPSQPSSRTLASPPRPGLALRILARALSIARIYTLWSNRVLSVEVGPPKALPQPSAAPERSAGRIVETRDAPPISMPGSPVARARAEADGRGAVLDVSDIPSAKAD